MGEKFLVFLDGCLEFFGLVRRSHMNLIIEDAHDAIELAEDAQAIAEDACRRAQEELKSLRLTPGEERALAAYRLEVMNLRADKIIREAREPILRF